MVKLSLRLKRQTYLQKFLKPQAILGNFTDNNRIKNNVYFAHSRARVYEKDIIWICSLYVYILW